MFDPGDILLYVLSSWRETSWTTFRKSFDELHRRQLATGHDAVVGDAALFRSRTLRMLVSLGHVDMSFGPTGAGTIVVCNPALVALPGPGVRRAVLVGARSPALVEKLRKAALDTSASLAVHPQGSSAPFAPSRIEVQASNIESFEKLAKIIGIPFSRFTPARAIARWSGSVDEYLARLIWAPNDDLNWYRQDFDQVSLRFASPDGEQAVIRLSRYQDPIRETWRYYRLFRGQEFATVNPDWGRYIVLSHQQRQVFEFDRTNSVVRVPTWVPLPVLLSRALVLCSGRSPVLGRTGELKEKRFGLRFDVYEGIPPSVANVVARKLGQ